MQKTMNHSIQKTFLFVPEAGTILLTPTRRPVTPEALHVAIRFWCKEIDDTWARYRVMYERDRAAAAELLAELHFLLNGFE